MKIILGTGQLGLALMQALLQYNPDEELTLINRSGKLGVPLPPTVRLVATDVTNPQQLAAATENATVIYSCTDVPYQHWDVFYPAVCNALEKVLHDNNARLVFADNLYSYGNVRGAVMHEEMPHAATSKKGKIRAAVLTRLLNPLSGISRRVAFVKAADFIGPGIHKGLLGTDFLNQLYTSKKTIFSGNLMLPHTFTYIHDFARAMVLIGEAPDAFGQVWHVPNAPAMSPENWIKLFEAGSGKTAGVISIPKFFVKAAGVFDVLLRELYELAYQFEFPYLVDHGKFDRRFGSIFTQPEIIVKETLNWYKSQKKHLHET